MREKVFVYGTLKEGGGLSHYMYADEGDPPMIVDEEAKLEGFTLYGRGVPMMVKDGRGWVVGELWEVSARTMALLDMVEGHPHAYRREQVEMTDGSKAWTYVWMHAILRHTPHIGERFDQRARGMRI